MSPKSTKPREMAPDLLIRVHSEGRALAFELNAVDSGLGLTFKSFGPHKVQRDPESFFNTFFQDLENHVACMTGTNPIEVQVLEDKGCNLFEEVFPEDLQDVLWRIRNQIKSLYILTDEPWIPWELCKLQGADEVYQTGPFFCEAFEMTRWFAGHPRTQWLPLRQVAVLGRGRQELPKIREEVSFLLHLANEERAVDEIEATWPNLRETLRSGAYDGLHIAGHGEFKPDDLFSTSLPLDDLHVVTPENITGAARNLGAKKPLVFLNSCYSGRGGLSLTGLSGWAQKFIKNGAGAFIGTQWAVPDSAALQFAKAFYRHFLGGHPLGRAVAKARGDVRARGDAAYLAFTVFGDPLARVSFENTIRPERRHPPARPVSSSPGYANRWRQLRTGDPTVWHAEHLPVLAVLAVVKEPVTLEMLADLAGVPKPKTQTVIQAWKNFLGQEVDASDETQLWMKSEFRDFFTNRAQQPGEGLDLKAIQLQVTHCLFRSLFAKQ